MAANLADFIHDDDQRVLEGRIYRLKRGGDTMLLAHPFEAIRWLRRPSGER